MATCTSATVTLDSLREERANIERAKLEQTPTLPQFNFYSNFESFVWGLVLGMPGPFMPIRLGTCLNRTYDVTNEVINFKNAMDVSQDMDIEEITSLGWKVYVAFTNWIFGCYGPFDHLRNKVKNYRTVVEDFMKSQEGMNESDFYKAGKYFGFAISNFIG